ncbi:MAG TPA: outer membrane beta-barrel protein [Herbaspirillum sp.]
MRGSEWKNSLTFKSSSHQKMKIKLAVALASTIFVTAVHAQTFQPGFYGGAEMGYSPIHDLSGSPAAKLQSELGGNVDFSRNKDVFSGRIFGGYKLTENVDLELGYFQSNSYGMNFSTTVGGLPYTGKLSQKVSGLDYSVLLRPSISTGFNGAFMRVGGHYSTIKADFLMNVGEYSKAQSTSQSGAGFTIGLGYDFDVAKHVAIRTEYNRMESIGGRSDTPMDTFRIGVIGKF